MIKKGKDNLSAYYFHQGTNYYAYKYLGAHYELNDKNEKCYSFRVWAPHAEKVFLIGDFNEWLNNSPMKRITDNGIFEIFVPEKEFWVQSKYKYKIIKGKKEIYKADPYAFCCEVPPKTASVFYDLNGFDWQDDSYLEYRRNTLCDRNYSLPINIYELHLGSWKRHDDGSFLSYRELAEQIAPYIKQMGYTHIELMPVMEHPFDGSWGYQVCGYYAPTSRFGTPHEFMYFVNEMHKAGIGVILDWVPAHFPKDEHGLYEFDGEPLYEFQGADRMEHRGWGTRKFDIARNEVECFLISNAMFWLSEYHIDGIRVDAVASMLYLDYDKMPGEWIPNIYGGNLSLETIAFLKKLNSAVNSKFPDILMIAEESTAYANITKPISEDGLGFDFKWNMGWMNDTLKYAATDPVFRKYSQDKLNFSLMYAFSENYILPISHDEVVHGKKSFLDKMPGDYWKKFAGSRAFLGYLMTHPGKKLLFMGSEIGQFAEWNYSSSVEWFLLDYEMHKKLQTYVRDLNNLYLFKSELWEIDYSWDGFKWISADDYENSVISFRRINKSGNELIVIINFLPVAREEYILNLPYKGSFTEIFNSDSLQYGGSGVLNEGRLKTENKKNINGSYTLRMRLPPLAVSILCK